MGKVVGPTLHRIAECETVLRTIPRWFGIEDSIVEYASATEHLPTFAWEEQDLLLGFISLKQHFSESCEIYCMAVRSEARGTGIGSKLLSHSEEWLQRQGVQLLQVKTLAAQHPSAEYEETRRFYATHGFAPVEVFAELWSPANPALQMVKVLGRGACCPTTR